MITNERQYKITKLQIENFRTSLDAISVVSAESVNTHPKILETAKNAIRSQLEELENVLNEYEALKSGEILIAKAHNLSELPLAMIRSRIANGFTQAELADKVGIKMQQIQRYESERYESASFKTLIKVADALGLSLDADIVLKTIANQEFDIKNYPFKQMFQRGWFEGFAGSLNDAVLQAHNLVDGLFASAGMNVQNLALNRRSIRSNDNFNEFALNAWHARVIAKAGYQTLASTFQRGNINDEWLRELRELSIFDNGPIKAAEFLKNSGIKFIAEPALDGTYLDGAAILTPEGIPIIAMTFRYDRLDNFWFVLMHEVAHLALHLTESDSVIFDDLDFSLEGIEKEADEFALNALVRNDSWKKSLIRFNPTEKGIINMAESYSINPALIAGRLRREKSTYTKFNDLIGQGQVRKWFLNTNIY